MSNKKKKYEAEREKLETMALSDVKDKMGLDAVKKSKFPAKTQSVSILLVIFLGFFAVHDFYLGLKKRGFLKLFILVVAVGMSAGMFVLVESAAKISFNYFFQLFMFAPLFVAVLWWCYDAIALCTKKSKDFSSGTKTQMENLVGKK